MRVDVKKYLFFGLSKEKEDFFKNAQELGIIHFIDPKKDTSKEIPIELQNTSAAIKVLRTLPVAEQEELEDYENAESITAQILQYKDKLEKLLEQERVLALEKSRLLPFGNYSMEDIHWIEKEGHRVIQFYCAKEGFAASGNVPENVLYIATDYGLDYFIGIHKQPTQYEKMIEIKPAGPIGELEEKHKLLRKQIHDTEANLKVYAKYNDYLHRSLINQLNKYHLLTAESYAGLALDDTLFAVEGWVPEDKTESLHNKLQPLHVNAEEVAIEPTDSMPTYLENEGLARVGEDLVHIYDTPSTTDKDPSLWVLFFFPLFFSMIVGDAGYGLVLLLTAFYIYYKYKNFSKLGWRVLKLFFILCVFTIMWGTLTTSFFGIKFAMDSPLRNVSLIKWLAEKKAEYHFEHKDAVYEEWVAKFPQLEQAKSSKEFLYQASTANENGSISYDMFDKFSDNIMFEAALFIGTIHIILSLLRYVGRNPTAIGWVAFIIGGYLYFPIYLDATSIVHFLFGVDKEAGAYNGIILMISGISIAVLIAIYKNKLLGIFEAMNVIQIFADIMSYLRLYALGLSGSLLASTMNELAGELNIILGTVVILASHVINIVLSIMGGVIHGLRLNFLEWYHYSFEGGGKKFIPLQKFEIE